MANGISRVHGKPEKVVIGIEELKDFVLLGNRRDIRTGVVSKLTQLLNSGEHFETPLVTNRLSGKERLIDGNHRFLAIKNFVTANPSKKVEVLIVYYESLNPQEERELYTQWNSGTKQNTNDFVKQYWSTIPIIKHMDKADFPYPVSHVWSEIAIEFKTLVNAYLTRDNKKFTGGFAGSAMEFVIEAQRLGENDCKVIKAFLIEYMDVFGKPNKKNMHYRQAVFFSLFRIWLENRDTKNPEQIAAAFRKVKGDLIVVKYSTMGASRDNCIACADELIQRINGNKIYNRFRINTQHKSEGQ